MMAAWLLVWTFSEGVICRGVDGNEVPIPMSVNGDLRYARFPKGPLKCRTTNGEAATILVEETTK